MFVGIAGGLRSWLQLGDVVVATKIYGYHGGRSTDEKFQTRPQAWNIPHAVEQVAQHVARLRKWHTDPPAVHFQPIAAGEVVLTGQRSALAIFLRDNYNDAIAVEMEAGGVAQAGHLNMGTPTVIIRGISDYADNTKDTTDETTARQKAVTNAAAFAMALIGQLAVTKPRRGHHTYTFNNVATDKANIVNNVGMPHPAAPPPADTLADVTAAMWAEHRAGRLDDRAFTLGMLALDDARAQLATTGQRDVLQVLTDKFGGHVRLRGFLAGLDGH
jgi:adenosylhomocysteine nucleosidase